LNGPAPMTDCSFVDFNIIVQGSQAPYLVHASYRQYTATGRLEEDIGDPMWLGRLEQMVATHGRPGRTAIEELGALLYERLFHHDVRDLWLRACADLDRGTAGVCLRLMTQSPAVAALPWEMLFDPDRNLAFARSIRTPLVRTETQFRHVGRTRSLRARLPLRMLAVLPEDPTTQIHPAEETRRLNEALGSLSPEVIDVALLKGRFSVVDLRQMIDRLRPDIVHITTHGQPEGVLLWQGETPVLTPASVLRTAFDDAESVRMVVLNACATAQGALNRSLASTGAQLLQSGVPAVIAMQSEIEESIAGDFTQHFYQALFTGPCPGIVPTAMSLARSSLYALNPDSIGYATPVLWLNVTDAALFDAAQLPKSIFRPQPPSVPRSHEIQALRKRLEETEAWFARLTPPDSTVLPLSLRPMQRMLQELLREIEDLLVQVHHLDAEPPTERSLNQYDEKLKMIDVKREAADRIAAILREAQS